MLFVVVVLLLLLLLLLHLRNLVATHPAAVGGEWSNHVWDPQESDPILPVFLVNRRASLSVSSLSLLKGMCTPLVRVLWILYTEFYDSLRDQCVLMGGTQTLCHHCSAKGLSGLSGGCLPNQQVRRLGPQQQHAPSTYNALT